MLKQILRDMWVDPEILAELDEDQKQVLFCKMREEQVRRWKEFDQIPSPLLKEALKTKGIKKKVDFLLGADGEPWVWIMGEHPDDKSIEEILEEEVKEKARELALQQIRKENEKLLAELNKVNSSTKDSEQLNSSIHAMRISPSPPSHSPEDMYCSVDEIINNKNEVAFKLNHNNGTRDILQEISLNQKEKVSTRVAQWEERLMEAKTSEIYRKIRKRKEEADREAELAEKEHHNHWREIQKKAKEADRAKREIARRAREEHRRSFLMNNDTESSSPTDSLENDQPPALPPRSPIHHSNNGHNTLSSSPSNSNGVVKPLAETLATSKPPSKDAIVEWFKSSQFSRRAGLEPGSDNVVAPWFHGLISRNEAEELLSSLPAGSFLVRVSERIWGYAISYRDNNRCKHYLIDASSGHYQFLGNNQISHKTLYDLVQYHSRKPITTLGGEVLGQPCRSHELPAIYQDLLVRAR